MAQGLNFNPQLCPRKAEVGTKKQGGVAKTAVFVTRGTITERGEESCTINPWQNDLWFCRVFGGTTREQTFVCRAASGYQGSMRSCGGAAGRVTILAERHGTPGPFRPFVMLLVAVALLIQSRHEGRPPLLPPHNQTQTFSPSGRS